MKRISISIKCSRCKIQQTAFLTLNVVNIVNIDFQNIKCIDPTCKSKFTADEIAIAAQLTVKDF